MTPLLRIGLAAAVLVAAASWLAFGKEWLVVELSTLQSIWLVTVLLVIGGLLWLFGDWLRRAGSSLEEFCSRESVAKYGISGPKLNLSGVGVAMQLGAVASLMAALVCGLARL